jgi:hypothetical protein
MFLSCVSAKWWSLYKGITLTLADTAKKGALEAWEDPILSANGLRLLSALFGQFFNALVGCSWLHNMCGSLDQLALLYQPNQSLVHKCCNARARLEATAEVTDVKHATEESKQ